MGKDTTYPYTNELVHETSPYLLQHAHNPVNWMPWGAKAWRKAKEENKLVIISIGYSACHWCHVMEHESFEDTAVAHIMNEHFICIKVDREERPDVDQVYMDAVQLISGRGGWPLNAFALPDGRPLYAGTYFPNQNWRELLLYLADYWKNHKEEAEKRAADITHGIKVTDMVEPAKEGNFTAAGRTAIFAKFDSSMDYQKGGRRGAPKFPMPVNYQYLLRNYYYTKNEKALKAVTALLDNMMNGGIYDQVGGGFARYSVDADWEIPHFEKMLYDNAQLVSLYSEAYRITRNERYKQVVEETLEFIEREMTDTSGGFYSALDADSEGEEGRYYVWTYEELKKILGADFDEFCKAYRVPEHGNFEGRINLVRNPQGIVPAAEMNAWKNKLLAERSKRVRPRLDDKILTSWNALMLMGYLDAYNTFGEKKYLDRALKNANFLSNKMLQPDGSLRRNYKNGKTTINGFLDDYSFICEAFISLYETTFDEHWLKLAKNIADYSIQHFYNLNSGLFFYTTILDEPLIARKTEVPDNVIPSSNSSMAKSLFKLGMLFDDSAYLGKSKRMAMTVRENMLAYPGYYANWAILSDWLISEPYMVAITGGNALHLREAFGTHFTPNCIFAGSTTTSSLPLLNDKFKPGETLIYVCQNKTCQLPVREVPDALKLLRH